MKKIPSKFYIQLALASFGGMVLAVGTARAVNPTVPDSVSLSPITRPSDPLSSSTLADRLAQRKSALKLQQTATRKQLILSKCVNVQTMLKNVQTKSEKAETVRQKKYESTANKLADTVSKLEQKNIDISSLKTTQTEFNSAVNKYLADYANFKAALADAVGVDCVSDPAGFEASLLTTRQVRLLLAKDSLAIKESVPQMKKELQTIKQNLSKSEAKNP